jgi:hypothetical protein
LEVNSVAEIFKRVAAFVGMEPKDVAEVSGHSVRVGATQDLLALNIDLASVMQAGRWKSNRMPKAIESPISKARVDCAPTRHADLAGSRAAFELLTNPCDR